MFPTSRLIALANLPLAAAAGALLWHSLDWPLVGDAAIFHFIAEQMRMGAIPYRDVYDVNMPLVYFLHLAIVALATLITSGPLRARFTSPGS